MDRMAEANDVWAEKSVICDVVGQQMSQTDERTENAVATCKDDQTDTGKFEDYEEEKRKEEKKNIYKDKTGFVSPWRGDMHMEN